MEQCSENIADDVTVDIDAPFPPGNQKRAVEIFIEQWNRRAKERHTFRESNFNVQQESFEKLVKGKKLDSNLKKCTAFVRKMKQYVESQKGSIESDLNVLNLTKYQSEIAAVIVEGRLKLSDISSMVAICSELHKRYVDFSGYLVENFKKTLPTKKTEVVPAIISKVSSDIRLLSELLLSGILNEQDGFNVLLTTVKTMSFLDKDGIQFLIPFSTLLRGLTDDLINVIPGDVCEAFRNNGHSLDQLIRSVAFSAERKKELFTVLKDYFDTVKSNVVKKHEELLKSEKYNRKLLITKGEIAADRQEAHSELSSRFEKYHNNATKLSYLLDIPMPVLRQLPADPEDELEKALLTTEDGEILTEVPGIVLFDNEEVRQFYQDYPDLKVYLPPVVYRDNILQMQEKTKKMEEQEKLVDEFDADLEQAELQEDKEAVEEEEFPADIEGDLPPSMRIDNEEEKEITETKETNAPPQRQAFLNYLDNLQNCVSKNMIDKAAIEFAENFNNKRHRRELVRRLFLVPRQRVDLVPLYSRLVAILSRVFPDIGMDLSTMLHKDFRYLVLKKDQIKIETKLKITRFIAELVNFAIFPKSEAFNCLKMLLRNFVHHQVEMACAFVETCGRFLYRSSDSHRRMKIYLDEMQRKKTVRNMEPRYVYMLDSAYYHICPPVGGSINRKKKSMMQTFLEYVLCEDLNKSTLERADKVLRKFDWSNEQNSNLVVKILSSPWKFNYVQMESAAALLASTKKFRPSVTMSVIENLTEEIRLGCDHEFEDLNNFRMATCQYLAYIYSYKAVSTTTLFNVWYYLISYGVTYRQDVFTKMDPPDNMYRVRMVCHMLRMCGDYLTSSNSRRRLNFFLKYFQRYYVYKRTLPHWDTFDFPHSVHEFFEETFRRLRNRWKLAKTMEEAEQDIVEMDELLRKKIKDDTVKAAIYSQTQCVRLPGTASTKAPKKSKKVRNKLSRTVPNPHQLNRIAEEPAEEIPEVVVEMNQVEDPYEQYEQTEKKLEESQDLDDVEFLAAFEKMCNEANQIPIKTSAKTDLPIPMSAAAKSSEPAEGVGNVNVTLVTKKNNKQKLKTLVVSADEEFIVSLKNREEAEKLEKQKVKSRTLAITRLQEEEERREEEQSVSQLVFGRPSFRR
ncbi:Regulator of nonsense transcripts 2 [Orchesella cincta]|uniref:Regulator of nonsense transcripts 2 n=1 Tax=Orchesella cincta TaxID=48709 RepID=A0A1D2NFQ7_ORCCI|nr:Regulator of nonsense transcripts 2 [Orchesella cincta]